MADGEHQPSRRNGKYNTSSYEHQATPVPPHTIPAPKAASLRSRALRIGQKRLDRVSQCHGCSEVIALRVEIRRPEVARERELGAAGAHSLRPIWLLLCELLGELPKPRIAAVRIVDMSSSNAWAEFAAVFARTRSAHLEHEQAKTELEGLSRTIPNRRSVIGVRAKRSKSGAICFDLLGTEDSVQRLGAAGPALTNRVRFAACRYSAVRVPLSDRQSQGAPLHPAAAIAGHLPCQSSI